MLPIGAPACYNHNLSGTTAIKPLGSGSRGASLKSFSVCLHCPTVYVALVEPTKWYRGKFPILKSAVGVRGAKVVAECLWSGPIEWRLNWEMAGQSGELRFARSPPTGSDSRSRPLSRFSLASNPTGFV